MHNNETQSVHHGQASFVAGEIPEEESEPPIRNRLWQHQQQQPQPQVGPHSRRPSILISPIALAQSRQERAARREPRRLNLLTRIQHDPSMENLVALSAHLERQRHRQHLQLPEISQRPPVSPRAAMDEAQDQERPSPEDSAGPVLEGASRRRGLDDDEKNEGEQPRIVAVEDGKQEEEEEEEEEDEMEEEDIYVDEAGEELARIVRTYSAPLLSLDSTSSSDESSSDDGDRGEPVLDLSLSSSSSSGSSASSDEPALAADGTLVMRMRSHSTADLPPNMHPEVMRRIVHHVTTTVLAAEDDILETRSLEEASRVFDILIKHCRTKVRAPPEDPPSQFDDGKLRNSLPFAIQEDDGHIDHVLHDKAFVALKIFAHLTLFDEHFQDVVELKSVMKMRTLHLHRHMLEGDEQHRILTAKFISFLSNNILRLSQWKRFVKPKAHALVEQYMKVPDPILDPYIINVRLSSDLRLPPSGLYYDVDVEEVCQIFTTSPTVGLAQGEVARRRANYGKNALPKPKRPSVILMLLRQVFDFMVLILIAAGILSGVMGDWEATIVLFAVVLFNVVLGFAQEFRAERAMAALMKMNVPFARVTRQGHVESINAEELVPGDIVLLEEGDQVTADLRLVEETDLHVVEALLTGESDPVEKSVATIFKRNIGVGDRRNMCFMGTLVTKGRGRGVVVATGKKTEIGKIQKNISQTKSKPSVLQRRLTILGLLLVVIALVACAIIAIVGIIWGKDWMTMIKVAVSIAVSAIPEGLVAILTVAAAAGTQNMAKKKAIVRRVNAVESLGSVTVICSDKTGTLTEGKMKTSDIIVGNAQYVVTTSSSSEFEGTIRTAPSAEHQQHQPHQPPAVEESHPQTEVNGDNVSEFPLLSKMLMAMALCNNATIQIATDKGNQPPTKKKWWQRNKKPKQQQQQHQQQQHQQQQGDAKEVAEQVQNDLKSSETPLLPDDPSPVSLEMSDVELNVTLPMDSDAAVAVEIPATDSKEEEQLEALGDPTEIALQLAAHYVQNGKRDWIDNKGCEFLNEFAFDSDRKRMTVVYRVPKKHCPFDATDIEQLAVEGETTDVDVEQEEKEASDQSGSGDGGGDNSAVDGADPADETSHWALAKGATESITSICSYVQTEEGTIVPMTPEKAIALERKSLSMAARGLRVLAFAYKAITPEEVNTKIYNLETHVEETQIESIDFVENGLIFLGFAGLVDPPREGVKESVAQCRAAGIRVIMITGDHQKTAQSIAETLGLFPPEVQTNAEQAQLVMKGDQVDELVATGRLDTLDPFPVVFARVSPENKMQIVETLQKRGEITSMVGDGVNDAASIRRADVGIAMGLSGTDLAKQAASVVLANDRFTTIVDAVREGRRTYDNIRKFIMYLLSCNFAEILLTLICVVSNQPTPFTSMMILYANLIADTPPALALGFEPADRGIMRRLPRNPKGGVFTLFGWMMLATQSAMMTAIALAAFLIAIHIERYQLLHAQAYTWALLTSVQLVHSFHSRSNVQSIFLKNPLSNLLIIVGVLVSFAGVFGGIYIPGLNTTLDLVPLGWWDWVKVLIAIAIHFVCMETIKLVIMAKNRTHRAIAKRRKSKERFYSEL